MSKNSHFFGNGRVIDIRYLTGKQGKPETIEEKRNDFEEYSGISWKTWTNKKSENPEDHIPYKDKFDINTGNFTTYFNLGEMPIEEKIHIIEQDDGSFWVVEGNEKDTLGRWKTRDEAENHLKELRI